MVVVVYFYMFIGVEKMLCSPHSLFCPHRQALPPVRKLPCRSAVFSLVKSAGQPAALCGKHGRQGSFVSFE